MLLVCILLLKTMKASFRAFEVAEAMAAERAESMRIDTHPDNKIMQGLIASLGYTYCGDVVIESRRLAYEKEI